MEQVSIGGVSVGGVRRSPTQVSTCDHLICDQRSPTQYSPEWLVVNTLKSRLMSPALRLMSPALSSDRLTTPTLVTFEYTDLLYSYVRPYIVLLQYSNLYE